MRDYLSQLEPLAVVVNPQAAMRKWKRRKRSRHLIEVAFQNKIYISSGGKKAMVDLIKELAPHLKTLITVGGDGTIADSLEGLCKAGCLNKVYFGIIPLGSGNAFRLAFGIPKNIRRAINIIRQGHTRLIDLIRFEDKVAGFVSVGATALVTELKLKHFLPGFWGHVWCGKKILSLKPQLWQIRLEDGLDNQGKRFDCLELEIPVLDAVIAKTNYFGYKWLIAPLAHPEDGWLDITFFEMSGLRYILSLPSIYFGRKQRNLRHYKARRITLSGVNLPVQYNGEFLGWRRQITFEVIPTALKLICPAHNKKPSSHSGERIWFKR